MESLININNLKTYFRSDSGVLPAVDGVTIEIKKGQIVALVGESGCGKSITSLSIINLLPDNGEILQGEIMFDGTDLCSLSAKEMMTIRGNEISMIFQEPMTSLNPVLTVGEQIVEGIRFHHKLSAEEAKMRAVDMLQLVGFARVTDIMREYPHQLSGGMRQRVMIAMAIATQPKLLIADEPTTALDVTIQAQILQLMRNIKEELGTAILLITHDLGVVAEMADKVIIMYAGQVMEEADITTLYKEPLHPYTVGLMQSIPSLELEQKRLYSIPGNVPLLSDLPSGCRFAPRCDKAMEKCHEGVPDLYSINFNHTVRCFLYENGVGGEAAVSTTHD